jgi:DNA-binding CsgD family transcriptional regulator
MTESRIVDHLEQVAGLGTWSWDPVTRQASWSKNLFGLFGVAPASVSPSAEFVASRILAVEREQYAVSLRALADGDTSPHEYRIVRPDGAVRVLQRVVADIDETRSGARTLIGTVSDVTRERTLEREVLLPLAVTRSIASWELWPDSAPRLLESVGALLGAQAGVLWAVGRHALMARAVWNRESSALDRLSAVTSGWQPGLHSPVLGRAISDGRPVLAAPASAGAPCERTSLIKGLRLESEVAVPAVFEHQTLAVLDFLVPEPLQALEALMRSLPCTANELGYFLARHRADLAQSVLTKREAEVLQLAAQGRSTDAIAQALFLSRATVKRHFERAYAKLNAPDRPAAVAEAMRLGLVS